MSGVGSQSGQATNSCGIRVAISRHRLNRNLVTFSGLALWQNIPPRTVTQLLCGSFLRRLGNVFSGLQLPALMQGLMKSQSHIVEGGGWVTRRTLGKPRARFFGFLSVVWLAVSIWASFPFWHGWPQSFGYWEWLCSALLVPQPMFIIMFAIFLRTEQPRTISEQNPNPQYDARKLY